jgi:flagellar motor protein MotB
MKTAQPIIIQRRKKHAHVHHGGAWKVAYADFVTAMMAFFLVMWLAAQDSRIRTAIAGYFQEPGLLPHEQSNSIVSSGQGGIDNSGMPLAVPRKPSGMLEAEQRALITAAEHIKQHMMQIGSQQLRGSGGAVRDVGRLADRTRRSVAVELLRQRQQRAAPETERILSVIAKEVGQLRE